VLRVTLYGFLPLSTLAPLSALTIVFSIILEYYILHDEMKQITIICSFFIIIGVGICSLSANIVDESYSLKSLQSLFFIRFNFIMTISLGAALLCCKQFLKLTSFFLNKEENNNLEKRSYNRINGNDNIDNNDGIGNNAYMDDEVDSNNDNINDKLNRHNQHYNSQYNQQNNAQNERENTHTNNYPVNFFTDFRSKVREDGLFLGYLGFFYLIFANALITGWFSVSAKAMIEIIKTTFFDGTKSESLSHPGLIILLFLLPLCSCAKMKYTWYALTLYAPLQYIPLYQSAVIFINSVFGLVYFQVSTYLHTHIHTRTFIHVRMTYVHVVCLLLLVY
jgi:Magnesium transporter NIPA